MGIGSAIGAIKGGQAEGRAARKNMYALQDYGKTAEDTQARIDPGQANRAGYAEQLRGIMSGEVDFQEDPGYQFRFSEGMRATERGMAAKGYNQSGNVQAALQERGQGLASQEYNNILTRLTDLGSAGTQAGIAGGQAYADVKQTSVTGAASARTAQGAAKATTYGAYGNLFDAGTQAGVTAYTGGMSGLTDLFSQGGAG
tara:strand:+ start:841 stop:1440 length:600 start_codon:yes stop_codon:yes gene_type:complete